jgi:RNA polymerase sigma-70 factor (ECF subfamily)
MALPEDKREVLILSRLQGLNHREIAEVLGCQPGAAKLRIHRALRDLRKQFFDLGREAGLPQPVSGRGTR